MNHAWNYGLDAKANHAASYEIFAKGWLQGVTVWGRPVDLEVFSGQTMLVSDDRAGAIYRITYKKSKTAR